MAHAHSDKYFTVEASQGLVTIRFTLNDTVFGRCERCGDIWGTEVLMSVDGTPSVDHHPARNAERLRSEAIASVKHALMYG